MKSEVTDLALFVGQTVAGATDSDSLNLPFATLRFSAEPALSNVKTKLPRRLGFDS
jgi:hypothetical protein